ncbi:PTS sugar transporter subunit IIB [Propionispora vibrioides]|uniref:PTS system, galactitol-specific IIB component n=1 Tax=Propionispora vibrioides TaxID=112903 RepID=A0A1H8RAF3_9FIRM|nr:PTS sugar transporter subunit IIB [Propionispora vibrioides]SEO63138.1 PTS system, galactitol-specific IIB component [Propionispora vibrioides]
MLKRKALVACGCGVASSTIVAKKVEDYCHDREIKVEWRICKAAEIPSLADMMKPDVIVSITAVPDLGNGIPVFDGKPFLTGIGVDKRLEEIYQAIKA